MKFREVKLWFGNGLSNVERLFFGEDDLGDLGLNYGSCISLISLRIALKRISIRGIRIRGN